MKLTRHGTWLALAFAFALAPGAIAQYGVPASTNYAAFGRFIADRNIFNPARYPHSPQPTQRYTPVSRSAPMFSLVGVMSYEKGLFAFFDGNNSDFRKVLSATQSIAGYTIASITPDSVRLESSDKKQTVDMKVGELMRHEDQGWRLSGRGDMSTYTTTSNSASDAPDASGAAPAASSLPANDTLRKLMEQRAKEQ